MIWHIEYFHSISSTHDAAKSLWQRSPDRFDHRVLLAEHQTHGRGAHGRVWVSPPGTDLYMTVCRDITLPIHSAAPLTLAIGLAVAEAIETTLGKNVAQIKWPNDILMGGRKCSGILVEALPHAHNRSVTGFAIGIGLNVNRRQFDASPDATSLSESDSQHRVFDRWRLLFLLLGLVDRKVDDFIAHGVSHLRPQLQPKLAWVGEPVVCGEISGTFVGIDDQGFAIIDSEGQKLRATTGPMRTIMPK